MLNQTIKEEKRKALNSPLRGTIEAIGVAEPDKENETSIDGGRIVRPEAELKRGISGYLDPGKEEVDRIHIVVLCLPEGEELEVSIHVWLLQELPHQPIHLQSSEYVEAHSHNGELPSQGLEVSEESRGSQGNFSNEVTEVSETVRQVGGKIIP